MFNHCVSEMLINIIINIIFGSMKLLNTDPQHWFLPNLFYFNSVVNLDPVWYRIFFLNGSGINCFPNPELIVFRIRIQVKLKKQVEMLPISLEVMLVAVGFFFFFDYMQCCGAGAGENSPAPGPSLPIN